MTTTAADQATHPFLHRWGERLTAALIRSRARFDGDLDKYLIYLLFVLDDMSAAAQDGTPGARRPLNQMSISDCTGIPRQSARRKLQALSEMGYLERLPGGLYRLGERCSPFEIFADLIPLLLGSVALDDRLHGADREQATRP